MIRTLFLLFAIVASPLRGDMESDIGKVQERVASIDTGKLIKLGGLVSRIGSGTSRLGILLERGDVDEIQQTLDDLDTDIHVFATDLKVLVHEDYHSSIDQSMNVVIANVDKMKGHVTEDNVDLARAEYLEMMENWDNLTDFYQKRLAGLLQDKEETRGWLNWALDWVHDWWSSGE